jgi:DNA polymerase-3 subunit chi
MYDIAFYHFKAEEPVKQFCKFLEQEYLAIGKNMIIRTLDDATQEMLNEVLWTFSKKSFLPHASKFDDDGQLQPIYITTTDELPNDAAILILYNRFDLTSDDLKSFKKILIILYDGNDIDVNEARDLYKSLKTQGHKLAYNAI